MSYIKLSSTTWLLGSPVAVIFGVSMIVSLPSPPHPEKQNEKRMMPPNCSAEKMREIRAKPTSDSDDYIKIDCNCSFTSNDTITKRLILEGHAASNVVINGNGATIDGGPDNEFNKGKDMIEVRSRSFLDGNIRKWERPENVSVKNFNIIGSVRVWGMAPNGEGKEYPDINGNMVNYYKNSSRTAGHVATARNNAPKGITFDNITITGLGRNPFYFAPGVTLSKLINSELKGESTHVAIYLDAESSGNVIKNNYIHCNTGGNVGDTWDRPLIAIDGSSHNLIINNKFSSLNHGGIYLYRNCGEKGVIRHTTPSYNHIINNIFYYRNYSGDNPAIYLSSRDRSNILGGFWFCDDDEGYSFGSSLSNSDFAIYNVVMENQIYIRSIKDMIKTNNRDVNKPNYVEHNTTVNDNNVKERLAGCYVPRGLTNFISDGKSTYLFKEGEEIRPVLSPNVTCNDGELISIIPLMRRN